MYGLTILLFPLSQSSPWLIGIYLLIGFFCHSGVGLMSELQSEIPQAMQGRVLSMFNTCVSVLATLVIQFLGAIGSTTAITGAYLAYGLSLICFGVFFLKFWLKAPT